jgi:alpha-L-fucosidase
VLIDEAYAGRVKKFEVQYEQNGAWQTLFADISIGADYQHKFTPVTAQKVRLNILEATDGPTINEFQLFAPGK